MEELAEDGVINLYSGRNLSGVASDRLYFDTEDMSFIYDHGYLYADGLFKLEDNELTLRYMIRSSYSRFWQQDPPKSVWTSAQREDNYLINTLDFTTVVTKFTVTEGDYVFLPSYYEKERPVRYSQMIVFEKDLWNGIGDQKVWYAGYHTQVKIRSCSKS